MDQIITTSQYRPEIPYTIVHIEFAPMNPYHQSWRLARFVDERVLHTYCLKRLWEMSLNWKGTYDLDGLTMDLDLSDRAQRRYLTDSSRIDELLLSDILQPGGTAWDVGAHVGFTSLLAVDVGAKLVVAFEPDPQNYKRLKKNYQNNYPDNIKPLPVAVSDTNGQSSFHSSSNSTSGINSLAKDERLEQNSTVETRSIDSLAAEHPDPNVIKIDVEGAEQKVLEGAREVLDSSGPDLIIEVHTANTGGRVDRLRQHGGSPENLFDILINHGYSVRGAIEDNNQLYYEDLTDPSSAPLHWVASKRSD